MVIPLPRSIVVFPNTVAALALKVAISPAPGTSAGSVPQLPLVDQSALTEPSQKSLTAEAGCSQRETPRALSAIRDEMPLERMGRQGVAWRGGFVMLVIIVDGS